MMLGQSYFNFILLYFQIYISTGFYLFHFTLKLYKDLQIDDYNTTTKCVCVWEGRSWVGQVWPPNAYLNTHMHK